MSDATYRVPQHPHPSDVDLWLENEEPIMIRAVHGKDPIELTAREARDLGMALIELADRVDASDAASEV